MSKAADLAKTSTKAGFNYLWGLVISTVISSLSTIVIGNLLEVDGFGLYSMALTIPTLLSLFRGWGMNQAMIRYTARYRAENREPDIRSVFIAGITAEITTGLLLSLLSFFMSGYIANVYGYPEVALLIQLASFSILANGLVSAATAAFTGTEKTVYNSIMLICQSVLRTILIVGLVLSGFGTVGALTGFTISATIAGLVGITFTIHLYRKIPKTSHSKLELREQTMEMLKYSTPLALLTILSGFLAQFYVIRLSTVWQDSTLVGNYNMAFTFVILINFFVLTITNMLFPAFSKLDIKKDKIALKNVFRLSVKYSALIVIPVAAIVMCLSPQAVTTLFKNYESTPLFLSLLAMGHLFAAVGTLSAGNLVNSQGQTRLSLKLAILTAAIGFPMGYILIAQYGVFGIIFTSIVAPIPSIILTLIWLKKHYDITMDWIASVKILLAAMTTAALTYLTVNYALSPFFLQVFNFAAIARWLGPAIELVLGVFFFIIVFIGAIIMTKTLSISDLNNLRAMTTSLGPITKIVHYLLNTMEKIMAKLKLT
jgi:O-antigen/teichoic acid export membrane protein